MVKIKLLNYITKLRPGYNKGSRNSLRSTGTDDSIKRSRDSVATAWSCSQNSLIDDEEVAHAPSRYMNLKPGDNHRYAPHNRYQTWRKDLTREEAEKHLKGRPDGTFLVRRSSNGSHALSLVCNGIIVHCIIHNKDGFYGFAAPFQHCDLKDLVLFYMENSLERHNPNLTTKLLYPAFS